MFWSYFAKELAKKNWRMVTVLKPFKNANSGYIMPEIV